MGNRTAFAALALLIFLTSSSTAFSQMTYIARDGKSDYVIMLAEKATLREWAAARELRDHLKKICGAVLPIVNGDGQEILPPDVLVNGDFERDPRIGWVGSGKLETFEWARGKGVNGSHAALLKDSAGGSARYVRTRRPLSVRPGSRYEISAEISKKIASGTGRLALWWRDAKDANVRTENLFFREGDHEWQLYAKIVTAPKGAVKVVPAVAFDQAGPGEILVDNVRLRPLGAEPPERHGTERAIVLGSAVPPGVIEDAETLGRDGFAIRTNGNRLYIAGNTDRGTLNGVYSLLEDDLGVRWLAPGVTHIPKDARLRLPRVRRRFVPSFESRLIYGVNAFDVDWTARQRLNTFIIPYRKWRIMSDHRTSDSRYFAVSQCHNLHALLAEGAGRTLKEIYDKHPEYFPVLSGKRRFYPHKEQLCLTNPDVLRLVSEGARKWAAKSPGASFLTISQEDVGRHCRCERCEAKYKEYGYPGAGVARVCHEFVNNVAERVKGKLPDSMRIDTIAYHFTQPCPPGFKGRSDVVVRYAPIRADMLHAFDEGLYNTQGGYTIGNVPTMVNSHKQLRQWADATPNLYVWYYTLVVPIFHPHPNLRSIGRNFRIMKEAGVRGIFVEHLSHVSGHELGHLKTYLYAKLTWRPDYDVEAGIKEFCGLYYGSATPKLLQYIELLHDENMWDWKNWSIWKKKRFCSCWDWLGDKPGKHYYTPVLYMRYSEHPPLKREFVVKGLRIFDEALAAAAGDAELERRVRVARIPVHFAGVEYLPKNDPLRARCIREFFPEAWKAVAGDNKLPKWLKEYEAKIKGTPKK